MSAGDSEAAFDCLQRVVPWRAEAGLEQSAILRGLLSDRAQEILEKRREDHG
jgi:hypothetical protein